MRLRTFIGTATVPLVLWGALPLVSSGAPTAGSASLTGKIESKRRAIEQRRGRERVLSGDIGAYSRRINAVQGDITVLQRRESRIQGDLDAKRAELTRIQESLRQERARLARLRARLARSRVVLARRLVELYKADEPDIVTVILEADGFADLLERSEFLRRVSDQDQRVMIAVRDARTEAIATAERLDSLERRQQRVTAIILRRRNEVAGVRGRLEQRRSGFARARDGRTRILRATQSTRRELESDLAALERENARVQGQLQGLGGPLPAGPIRGGGSLIWPVNGPITSPFGPRWGRLHAGIDIAAPGGTPIRAADSGRVVLLGPTGAYGNYTCVQHGGVLSTCYAHQSGFATSKGASVSRGQVIGYVGNTGRSFGNHLHFETRINGTPVNPMQYL